MSTGWENYEPAPIEFLHGRLMELFHEFRKTKTNNINVEINGSEFGHLIAKAKTETYTKYSMQNLQRNIPKSEM